MAKEDYTKEQLIAVEDELQETIAQLREMRRMMDAESETTINLNFGTVQYYAHWLEAWAKKNVGIVEGQLSARRRKKNGG